MKIEMQIKLEVNQQAEYFYEDAIQLGDHAAYALGARRRSQMTGLENIADSALKVSDILDYIKRQTARFTYWRQNFHLDASSQLFYDRSRSSGRAYGQLEESDPANMAFGERLKLYIEKHLAEKRDAICSKKRLNIGYQTDEDRQLQRRIYLLLIRQFIRHMVIQYEYRVSFDDTKKGA